MWLISRKDVAVKIQANSLNKQLTLVNVIRFRRQDVLKSLSSFSIVRRTNLLLLYLQDGT